MAKQSIQELLARAGNYREQLAAEYYQLTDARDAVYEKAKPVEEKLAAACLRTEAAKAEELKLAAEVEAIWGPDWIALKKRIADIARVLIRIPPRPAK